MAVIVQWLVYLTGNLEGTGSNLARGNFFNILTAAFYTPNCYRLLLPLINCQYSWRRSALSECFSLVIIIINIIIIIITITIIIIIIAITILQEVNCLSVF